MDALVPAPFTLDAEHIWIDLGRARALFTTRRGGYSSGAYASLNLGFMTDDDSQTVQRNREAVEALARARLAYGRQVHGRDVVRADVPTAPGELPAPADGQVTNLAGVAPMVLTADCLPVAIAAPGAVGMLHAGWRGLACGVIEAGLAQLRRLAPTGEIRAAIGPGAGPCCYEVGEEVHSHFAAVPGARRGNNLDLKLVARSRLALAGAAAVYDCGLCTMCADPALFFSHRRDGGVTGRQGGVSWLT